jgi:DNA-binding NtrC family response regulator
MCSRSPRKAWSSSFAAVTAAAETGLSLPARIASIERQAISRALEMTGGKKAPAARILGISRSQLYDKIRDHRLYD